MLRVEISGDDSQRLQTWHMMTMMMMKTKAMTTMMKMMTLGETLRFGLGDL